MRKPLHLLLAVLTLTILSTSSTYADWGSRGGWFGSWGGGFFSWGHRGSWGHNNHDNRGWHRWGKDRDNNGNNGCERSNSHSRACDQNPNTTFICIIWTNTEVRHPETFESAYTSGDTVWQLGDTAVFDSGATCLVDEAPPPGGR